MGVGVGKGEGEKEGGSIGETASCGSAGTGIDFVIIKLIIFGGHFVIIKLIIGHFVVIKLIIGNGRRSN
jgi:hypothetical protein